MNAAARFARYCLAAVVCAAAVSVAGYSKSSRSQPIKVTLSGDQEIPPVATSASGTGTFLVGADKSVSGGVTIAGMSVTVAHIHEAAAGKNGPIVFPLAKTSETVWSVPAGVQLTDAQYESYKAGNLYFNIHSEAHRAGEIRGQIRP